MWVLSKEVGQAGLGLKWSAGPVCLALVNWQVFVELTDSRIFKKSSDCNCDNSLLIFSVKPRANCGGNSCVNILLFHRYQAKTKNKLLLIPVFCVNRTFGKDHLLWIVLSWLVYGQKLACTTYVYMTDL
jgi:hypothetical protein